jgi:type VI secretion system protein VasG
VDAILTHNVLPEISKEFLTRMMEGQAIKRVHVGESGGQFTYSFD